MIRAISMRSPALFDFYEPQLGVALLIMHSMKLRLIYCIVNFKVGMQTSIISLYVAHKHACTHLEREIRLSRLPPLSGGNSPPLSPQVIPVSAVRRPKLCQARTVVIGVASAHKFVFTI